MKPHIHFIAIGGSAMHNLALALHHQGYRITGSDDEIFEPSKSRLAQAGILPEEEGWHPEKLTSDIDSIILGMHAREDNPELIRAKELGLKIYSYPEYLYEHTKGKTRIVVGGSHGKTTTTSMIMHVLKSCKIDFDYMVGASVEGFDTMVKLSDEAKYAVFEGDEYLTSPIDRTPKFHHYFPDIAIVTGIAWDHMNVFPTFDFYVEQFRIFAHSIMPNGVFIYNGNDENLKTIAHGNRSDITNIPYSALPYHTQEGLCYLDVDGITPVNVFGRHNFENMAAAYHACKQIGVTDQQFLTAISSFKGAQKRLQLIVDKPDRKAYLDFAHAPSKLKATIDAVKEMYPEYRIVACMELHTFSSLNSDFLPQYNHAMDKADCACVYYNPEVIAHKHLAPILHKQVKDAFANDKLQVFTDNQEMLHFLEKQDYTHTILLFMSSGTFSGMNLTEVAQQLLSH